MRPRINMCMCVCMCAYVHVYMYMLVYIHMYVCICIRIRVCRYIYRPYMYSPPVMPGDDPCASAHVLCTAWCMPCITRVFVHYTATHIAYTNFTFSVFGCVYVIDPKEVCLFINRKKKLMPVACLVDRYRFAISQQTCGSRVCRCPICTKKCAHRTKCTFFAPSQLLRFWSKTRFV
jgi:hypothetical protein